MPNKSEHSIHCGRRFVKPLIERPIEFLIERPLEFLGLKEKKNLELKLRKLSKEELKALHKSESFKIGSAFTGVFINGSLTCVFPSNAVGTAVNLQQLCVAIRSRRKIEKAARLYHDADFRHGDERCSRFRHYVAGGTMKTAFAVLFLGHDDFLGLAHVVTGMDLYCPVTDVELTVKNAVDETYANSFVTNVQTLGGLDPAQHVLDALGMKYNPMWEEALQSDSVSQGLEAGAGVGAANEANVAMLLGDKAAVSAHKIIVGESSEERKSLPNRNGPHLTQKFKGK